MAFGNSVPQDILTGFPNPKWVNDWANLMLIIHMIPAYQVYLQPTIAFTEHHFSQWARAPAWLKVWVGVSWWRGKEAGREGGEDAW